MALTRQQRDYDAWYMQQLTTCKYCGYDVLGDCGCHCGNCGEAIENCTCESKDGWKIGSRQDTGIDDFEYKKC